MRVAWLKDLRMTDLEQVGGKNASLGEMIGGLAAAGIRVPGGFATTAQGFRELLGDLGPRINERVRSVDPRGARVPRVPRRPRSQDQGAAAPPRPERRTGARQVRRRDPLMDPAAALSQG